MIKIIMLLLLILIPIRINASDVEKFNYNQNRIYDYSDIFNNDEQEELVEEIEKFIKLSKIDLILVSVDDKYERNKLYTLISDSPKFGKGIKKNGIVLVAIKDSYKLEIFTFGDYFRDSISIKKFEVRHVNKYDQGNTSLFEIDKIIKEWNHYYVLNTIKTYIFIILFSIIITIINCKLILKNYKIKKISDASNYYDPKEIKFLS